MKKNVLVLSGGSVEGSFQAGAIKAVIEKGIFPDVIYGVSVGSLNGAFMANLAGQKYKPGAPLTQADWDDIAQQLWNFWTDKIRAPKDVAITRSVITDAWNILFKGFNGLANTAPITAKIDSVLNLEWLQNAPVVIKVGSVDVITGELLYKKPSDDGFIDYVKGSMAIPVEMPPTLYQNKVLFDGGTREVAPIGTALNDESLSGSEVNIIAIVCQSAKLTDENNFNPGDLMTLADRLLDIVVNNNVDNDIKYVDIINRLVDEANNLHVMLPTLQKYSHVEHSVIRPAKELTIDITTFTAKDIEANLFLGYETARQQLSKQTAQKVM